jgi:hypothetical protein
VILTSIGLVLIHQLNLLLLQVHHSNLMSMNKEDGFQDLFCLVLSTYISVISKKTVIYFPIYHTLSLIIQLFYDKVTPIFIIKMNYL